MVVVEQAKNVKNSICGKNKCYESAVTQVFFKAGFSAWFCQKCADKLIIDNIGRDGFEAEQDKIGG